MTLRASADGAAAMLRYAITLTRRAFRCRHRDDAHAAVLCVRDASINRCACAQRRSSSASVMPLMLILMFFAAAFTVATRYHSAG